ncbi:MAG: nucleoside deaminase [Candidatus Saccharimonadales bacterium]
MDDKYLRLAIQESRESVVEGGFPVGVILVAKDRVLATGISNGKQLNDPTSHGEISAIRKACAALQTRQLGNVTLYSSMEPCLMCYSACIWASIPKIVYAGTRRHLSLIHFEGTHDLSQINSQSRKPIQLIHNEMMEPEALSIVKQWEDNQRSN